MHDIHAWRVNVGADGLPCRVMHGRARAGSHFDETRRFFVGAVERRSNDSPRVTANARSPGATGALPALVEIDDDPGRTSAELARHTHVTAQAMNQVLQGLQEIGLVTRPATASSGRALPAQLTRKGKALLRRAEEAVAASDEQLLAHLSLADRRQLKSLLYRAGNPSADEISACAQGAESRLS